MVKNARSIIGKVYFDIEKVEKVTCILCLAAVRLKILLCKSIRLGRRLGRSLLESHSEQLSLEDGTLLLCFA